MKKYILLAILLAAGMTASPQATRKAKQSKSKSSQVSRSSIKRSGNTARFSSRSSSQKTKPKSVAPVKRSNQHTATKKNTVRSTRSSIPSGVKGRTSLRNNGQKNRSRSVNRFSRTHSSKSVRSVTSVTRGRSNLTNTNAASASTRSRNNVSRSSDTGRSGTVRRSSGASRSAAAASTVTRGRAVTKPVARRVMRVVNRNYYYRPISIEIRRMRYPYRIPAYIDLVWTPTLLNRFIFYYPTCRNWYYDYGDYIETLSAYDASAYVGYVKRVYGRVEEVYYSSEDQNYYLYFGQPFPYHDFSVVIPRHIARQISLTPTWYFQNENVWVVGLIETWDNKPEIVLHDQDQIRRY